MAASKCTNEIFIEKSKKIYGDRYDYSKLIYNGSKNKVCIICPEHGEFNKRASDFLQGKGCPKCANAYKPHPKKYTTERWIEKAKSVHGNKYDYSKSEYISPYDNVIIICPKHGEFKQKASYHLSGNGCPKCGYEKVSSALLGNKEQFVKDARKIYGDKYDYSKVEYINNKTEVAVICPKHGEFKVRPDNHLTGRNGCPLCSVKHSMWEKDVLEYIKSLETDVISGEKKILCGKELDIFIPNKKIAFECDGLRWHSEMFKNKMYHLEKTIKARENGVSLFHIFEDEWVFKNDIVKSRIKSILGLNNKIIYARKCKIRGISEEKAKKFLNENHLQGYLHADYSYGLYYDGKLVCVSSFGYYRTNLGKKRKPREYELLRLCSILDTSIIGGASRLLNFFIKRKNPKKIISYCDLRWSDGNVYEKIGFTLSHVSKPNYFYIVNNVRKNRFNYRKDKLISEGFDPNKTEHEIMLERGIYRIYDCGCKVYEMKIGF